MTGDGKEKDIKVSPDSECSSSQAAKFSGKNVEEIQKQENCTQEQKESANDVVDDQKCKGIDAVDIESVKLETTRPTAEMDKHEDLNFNKDNEKAASVTPKVICSKVEVKKGDAKVGRKTESSTRNTPLVTRSTEKEKKDPDCNKGKATQKTIKDGKYAGTSEGITSPTKKLFEYKTKLTSKGTNKVQVSKSPANADLKSPRTKAGTGFHALKSPANSESKLLRTKVNTGSTASKSPANTELKSLRTKAATAVSALKPPVISETRLMRNKSNMRLLVPKSPANAESKTGRTKSKTGLILSKSPANADSKLLGSKANTEPNLISPNPLLEDSRLKTIDEQKQPLKSEITVKVVRTFESMSQVPKQENNDEQIQLFESNKTDLNPEVGPSKSLLGDSILKDIDEQKPLDSTITEPNIELNTCEPLPQDLIPKNIEDQKQPLESSITARNIAINTPTPSLQDSIILAIDENLRKLDLDASRVEQDASLVNQNINVHQDMENEKIINLKSDVNFSYEFDDHGNEKILVDSKDQYNVDVNQKITFNIGENAKISVNGGKVFISTYGGQIVCSMQRNRVVFSLNENTLKSDSLPEDQRSSDVHQSLQDSLNDFVTNIKTNCEKFEYNFLKSLEYRN